MSPNRPYIDEDDLPTRGYSERSSEGADREISLGTPTILGIFFALAVICAMFFGFGYTMGRHSTQSAPVDTAAADNGAAETSSTPKPAAGSPAPQPVVAAQPSAGEGNSPATPEAAAPTASVPLDSPPSSASAVAPSDRVIVGDKLPGAPPSHPAASAVPQSPSAAPSSGSFMVQVAAVSTQDIADIEVAALKKQGFNVVVRHEPTDKLLHVQIGPFADKKDAEAMRQRVLADGFNAIVK